MTLGNLIREYREKAEMTQLELAIKLGYSNQQFVYLMESGKSKVPMIILGKMFTIFKLSEELQYNIFKGVVELHEREIRKEILKGKSSIKN